MTDSPAALSYDLRLGVVGHRDLCEPDAIHSAVMRLLDNLQRTLDSASASPFGPHGSLRTLTQRFDSCLARVAAPLLHLAGQPIPLAPETTPEDRRTGVKVTIVSPLAKGADRIVARAVLGRPHARLEVVAPLPLAEYRKDFTDAGEQQEFDELLVQDDRSARNVLIASWDETVGTPEERNVARREAYAAGGRFVVDACEILIVVWDGKSAARVGGTGRTVQYALQRGRKVIWIDSSQPDVAARWLTKNESGEATAGPLPGTWTQRLPRRAKELSLGFHRLAAYQRDAAFDPTACKTKVTKATDLLADQARRAGLPQEVFDQMLARLVPHYGRADQLALLYRRLYTFAAKWLFRLSAIAVTIVVVQLLFFPHALWLIAFEIAAMLAVVVLLRISGNEAWHEKWLNDRHVAEWLRWSTFLLLLDEEKETPGETDRQQELPFYEGPDYWYLQAFAPLMNEVRQLRRDRLPLAPLRKFLVQGWIEDQANYHRGNAQIKRDLAHRMHRLGLVLFCTTLVMALLHLMGVGHEHQVVAEHPVSHSVETTAGLSIAWRLIGLTITLLAIILPVWGAAIHAIANLLDFERIAERSERMADVLVASAERAKRATSHDELQTEIRYAARVMAAENHEWLASLSFRGLVLPA